MRHPTLAVACTFLLLAFQGACKKAEQPVSPDSRAEKSAGGQGTSETRAPSKAASSGQGVLLKVKWPVGNRYVYRMDLDQHSTNKIPQMPKPMQQDVTMAMTYALTVMKETDNGGRELEMEFLANEMEIKMADQIVMSFDSKESGKAEAQNVFVAPFRKMIGSKIKLQVDADGKVEKVLGLEEWLSSLAGDDPGPARGMLSQQFNEGYFRQIADFGRGLPEKAVEIGDTWPLEMEMPAGPMGKIAIKATILLKDWGERDGHNCAVLSSIGTFKGTPGQGAGPMANMTIEQGKLSGTTWFAADLGALIESDTDQSMRLKGDMPSPPGANAPAAQFTSDLGQKINLKLVELTKAATQ